MNYLIHSVFHCIFFFCRKLGLDLVPRVENRIVGPDCLGVYELYKVVRILFLFAISMISIMILMNLIFWNFLNRCSTLPARRGTPT